jgi:hypothetical protein
MGKKTLFLKVVDSLELSADYSVVEVDLPKSYEGKPYARSQKYHLLIPLPSLKKGGQTIDRQYSEEIECAALRALTCSMRAIFWWFVDPTRTSRIFFTEGEVGLCYFAFAKRNKKKLTTKHSREVKTTRLESRMLV